MESTVNHSDAHNNLPFYSFVMMSSKLVGSVLLDTPKHMNGEKKKDTRASDMNVPDEAPIHDVFQPRFKQNS